MQHTPDTAPAPISEAQRIESLDVVRGFALLGILVPNIVAFAWPQAAMTDPSFMGPEGSNEAGHAVTSVFFLGKMMALFSMLFGAGVVIFDRKTAAPKEREKGDTACERCGCDLGGLAAPGRRLTCPECGREQRVGYRSATPLTTGAGLWYSRMGWLLAIGVAHGMLLWYGDILVWYAVAGLLAVWWVRRIDPKLQIGLGIALHLVSTLFLLAFSALAIWAVQHGKIGPDEMMGDPTAEMNAYTGGYLDTFGARLPTLIMFWGFLGPMFMPGVTGLMMMGMGLTRLGILTGERPARFYAVMTGLGLVGGLGLTVTLFLGLERLWPEWGGFIWQSIAQFVGIPIALGYMGLVVWLVRAGIARWLTGAMADVGRMALTNYLLQTLLCTTFFYGYGLGFFGEIDYPGLFGVVAGVWLANILFSRLWLRAFRFGPAEWVWRALTYRRLPPMRRAER